MSGWRRSITPRPFRAATALTKELGKARAMAGILAAQSAEMRAKGEALIQQADKLSAKAGTSGCAATVSQSTHRPPLIEPSAVDSPGWRFNARDARRPAMSISRR